MIIFAVIFIVGIALGTVKWRLRLKISTRLQNHMPNIKNLVDDYSNEFKTSEFDLIIRKKLYLTFLDLELDNWITKYKKLDIFAVLLIGGSIVAQIIFDAGI